MYEVIEIKTGIRKGIYKSRKAAKRAADKFDLEVGGVRFTYREISICTK